MNIPISLVHHTHSWETFLFDRQGLLLDRQKPTDSLSSPTYSGLHFIKENEEGPSWDDQIFTFRGLPPESAQAKEIFDLGLKEHRRAVYQFNLQTIEGMVALNQEIKSLWESDRNLALEEIWYILKKNCGALELNLYFHDLKPIEDSEGTGESSSRRQSLSPCLLGGEARPEFRWDDPKAEFLLTQKEFLLGDSSEILEWDSQTGRAVIRLVISGSPILVLANCVFLEKLQTSVIKGLFQIP